MTDIEVLRGRLRDYADGLGAPPVILHDVGELVTLLREADAEIKALRADVEAWKASHTMLTDTCHHFQARAERLAEEIDWIKSQPEDDRMFAEIEAAAKASFHRHRTSCRGQVLTRADNYESHLVWSALEWAKLTNGAEQHAEQLAEALRFYADTNNWIGRFVTDPTTPAEEDGGDNARAALRDYDQEEK